MKTTCDAYPKCSLPQQVEDENWGKPDLPGLTGKQAVS